MHFAEQDHPNLRCLDVLQQLLEAPRHIKQPGGLRLRANDLAVGAVLGHNVAIGVAGVAADVL